MNISTMWLKCLILYLLVILKIMTLENYRNGQLVEKFG